MIAVCRPYGGVTINNRVEFLFNEDGDIIEFKDVWAAKEWLKNNGIDDEYMSILMFVDLNNGKLIEEE